MTSVNVLNSDIKLKTGFVPKYVNLFEIAAYTKKIFNLNKSLNLCISVLFQMKLLMYLLYYVRGVLCEALRGGLCDALRAGLGESLIHTWVIYSEINAILKMNLGDGLQSWQIGKL